MENAFSIRTGKEGTPFVLANSIQSLVYAFIHKYITDKDYLISEDSRYGLPYVFDLVIYYKDKNVCSFTNFFKQKAYSGDVREEFVVDFEDGYYIYCDYVIIKDDTIGKIIPIIDNSWHSLEIVTFIFETPKYILKYHFDHACMEDVDWIAKSNDLNVLIDTMGRHVANNLTETFLDGAEYTLYFEDKEIDMLEGVKLNINGKDFELDKYHRIKGKDRELYYNCFCLTYFKRIIIINDNDNNRTFIRTDKNDNIVISYSSIKM